MKLGELFEVKYGINLELNACEPAEGAEGINFVARTAENNGVVAKVKLIKGKQPQPAGLITCAAGGSVLSSFVQPEPFYSGRDLYLLIPKAEMSLEEKLFYCYAIKMNAFRYQYGRQANKTLKNLELPPLPQWFKEYKIDFSKIKTNKTYEKLSLNKRNWHFFQLSDLFEVERGTRLTKENRAFGDIPLATAGRQNEGIAENICHENRKLYSKVLTIDMFCNCFYRPYQFTCDDNILVLFPKFLQNQFIALFLASVIETDRYRYAYGRQYRQKDFFKHQIKLPAQKGKNGKFNPDWQFMEDYIKSLPNGDLI